jgi:hypothetical protein
VQVRQSVFVALQPFGQLEVVVTHMPAVLQVAADVLVVPLQVCAAVQPPQS